jgi:hypothetical protein
MLAINQLGKSYGAQTLFRDASVNLAKGQCYGVDPGSDINNLYHVRDGQLERDCGSSSDSAECPVLHKRIWGDGPKWPPN